MSDTDRLALEVRIRMLEREFRETDKRNTTMLYLLQVELEHAYKAYMTEIPCYAEQ